MRTVSRAINVVAGNDSSSSLNDETARRLHNGNSRKVLTFFVPFCFHLNAGVILSPLLLIIDCSQCFFKGSTISYTLGIHFVFLIFAIFIDKL